MNILPIRPPRQPIRYSHGTVYQWVKRQLEETPDLEPFEFGKQVFFANGAVIERTNIGDACNPPPDEPYAQARARRFYFEKQIEKELEVYEQIEKAIMDWCNAGMKDPHLGHVPPQWTAELIDQKKVVVALQEALKKLVGANKPTEGVPDRSIPLQQEKYEQTIQWLRHMKP